ncbi:MAG TPA: protein kinase [Candidatus Acidoferrum sp.]|nr:protein kinase [Candidatus Acidoferrum sp.]
MRVGETFGNYRVLGKLGEGGMGVVYRARDEVLQRDVAIKVLSSRTTAEKSARESLLGEARAVSALSHPNICTIYQVGEADGELYIVMELIEGKPLSGLIRKDPVPVESVLRYGVQIAGALAHSHGRNIVHRDLKSANVMVTPEGLAKVLDFGLARRVRKEVLKETLRTIEAREAMGGATEDSTGGLTGTLPYMPPEVLRGQEADYRGDIWALGVVLYEAASGKLPFFGQTTIETSAAILHQMPAPLPSWVPPGIWSVVQRCLTKEPQQRYQRASEVQAALEAIQSASSVVTGGSASPPAGPLTTVVRGIRRIGVKDGDVLLLVGTMKGAFMLRSNARRSHWDVIGPAFHGQAVYTMTFDAREGLHRLWASTSTFWGTLLRCSDDYGKTWTNPQRANVRFPEECGTSLKNIWQVRLGRQSEPRTLYCGVEPAALFVSHDGGETWGLIRGLFDHPHRPRWQPGNGGLCLHTILLDPEEHQRMYVAISAGGVYRSDDGGATWQAKNQGIRVAYQPDKYPEFGQCVHKMVLHPARPERIFLQHHWGLYRSDDRGDTWKSISNGVPSDFGFAMMMHPRDPDCVYVIPIESDEFRCTPDGRLRVYRTRNGGASWEPLARGLPQRDAYKTVLRDGMDTDRLDPAGIYFGTRSGELFGSLDEGKSWKMILSGLPPIVCVKSVVVGEPRSDRATKRVAESKSQPRKKESNHKTKRGRR